LTMASWSIENAPEMLPPMSYPGPVLLVDWDAALVCDWDGCCAISR
jgi:hypothetical protein